VFFEGPDGAFRGVAATSVRWQELLIDIIDGEEILQNGRCLVVESLEFWLETLDSELFVNPSGKTGTQITQLPLGDNSPPWGDNAVCT
jgi:hypothetical protein